MCGGTPGSPAGSPRYELDAVRDVLRKRPVAKQLLSAPIQYAVRAHRYRLARSICRLYAESAAVSSSRVAQSKDDELLLPWIHLVAWPAPANALTGRHCAYGRGGEVDTTARCWPASPNQSMRCTVGHGCRCYWRAMVTSIRGGTPGAGRDELPAPSPRGDGALRYRGTPWRVVLCRSRRAGQGVASVRSRGVRFVSSLWSTRARFRSSQVRALSPRACGGV